MQPATKENAGWIRCALLMRFNNNNKKFIRRWDSEREHFYIAHVPQKLKYKHENLLKYLSISSFVLVYKNLVRSQLDYCNSVWTPYRKSDIETLEKVQKGN